MVGQILATWDECSPAEVAAGVAWYERASEAAHTLAERHDETFLRCAAVIAALSPRMQWAPNVRAADKLIAAHVAGEATAPRVGLGNSVARAWRILEAPGDADIAHLLGEGPKIGAFWRNITGDHVAVTVDTWTIRVAEGDYAADSPRGPRYRRIVEAFRRAAIIAGLSPRDLQATVWVHIRGKAD